MHIYFLPRESRKRIDRGTDHIGSVYRKVIYREFTDDTFTTMLPVANWWGLVGPLIKAEVGETVHVHFRNLASYGNFSVHPHGFQYGKGGEGIGLVNR